MTIETALLVGVLLLLLSMQSRLNSIDAAVRRLLAAQQLDAQREPSEEVVALVRAGKKVKAMRLYRQQSGAELREAKGVIENISATP
jgi:ribosomal protein L7/L12